MKKVLISIAALAFAALMITSAYAALPTIPTPCYVCYPGFTPGFWKHDIAVYLELDKGGKGSYNAFEYDNAWGSILAGTKMTASMLEGFLDLINSYNQGLNLDFPTALAILKLPGSDARRTNLCNWFNIVAGYGSLWD
jgi:hypothetical protein